MLLCNHITQQVLLFEMKLFTHTDETKPLKDKIDYNIASPMKKFKLLK